jgi:hypothetical protein
VTPEELAGRRRTIAADAAERRAALEAQEQAFAERTAATRAKIITQLWGAQRERALQELAADEEHHRQNVRKEEAADVHGHPTSGAEAPPAPRSCGRLGPRGNAMDEWPLGVLLILLGLNVLTVGRLLPRLRGALIGGERNPALRYLVVLLVNVWAGVLIMAAIFRQR